MWTMMTAPVGQLLLRAVLRHPWKEGKQQEQLTSLVVMQRRRKRRFAHPCAAVLTLCLSRALHVSAEAANCSLN